MTGKKAKRSRLKAAGRSGKSKAKHSLQGADLPVDASPLGAYPIGCCVLISASDGHPAWHLIRFRIGKSGNPHCGRLTSDPASAGWNARMGEARETREDTIVLASCWPFRAAIDEGAELDPLAIQSDRTMQGSILNSHLREPP